jgi:Xaa-Pro aminopeptidase
MHTMHPTLLIGPADWNAARMPRADYEARIDALFANTQAGGAIVFGNSLDHAALSYLTGFTPKLEEGMALIPRVGAPRLLVRGSVNMIAAARPLTWVSDLVPLREPGKSVADWARDLPDGGRLLMIGGDAMPFSMRRAIDQALADGDAVHDGTKLLQAQMLRKTPRELAALREACVGLEVAVVALRAAQSSRSGVTAAVLAAEHAALGWGAQDVRSLFSLDSGRTLRPFELPVEQAVEPLQVYLAVRHAGYWADGFVRLGRADDPLHAKTSGILRKMIAATRPGLHCRELWQIVDANRGEFALHPLAKTVLGSSIGLALDEQPLLSRDGDAELSPGAVYSLRAGVTDGKGSGAIASAMLVVTDRGHEVIWPAGEQA